MSAYSDSKNILPSQQGWIHELARGELYPDVEKALQMGSSFDPQQLVEESTIEFLAELREKFAEYAKVFNTFSEKGTRFQEIKVYSAAQTAADFMVFRNQIKLLVTNVSHGVIQLVFTHHVRGTLSVDGQVQVTSGGAAAQGAAQAPQPQDLLAQVGPFRDVFWTFQGEKVTPEQVAKFYFIEFARATRDARKTKSGNQFLLEQIKTLLQEKGLEL